MVDKVEVPNLGESHCEHISEWFKIEGIFRDQKLLLKPFPFYASFNALGLISPTLIVLLIKFGKLAYLRRN